MVKEVVGTRCGVPRTHVTAIPRLWTGVVAPFD